MSLTLQGVFNRYFDEYTSRHKLSKDMWYAVSRIRACRTSLLGGHINSCPQGHYHSIAYNSCMHRACPQCAWLERERWLTRWKARLLPTSHYHIVFTLPHQYIPLWKLNRRAVADLLFQAARKSLEELLEDPKYLGAKPGILAALHTWNQKLQPHLHLHVLVTDGGLNGQSQWVMPVKRCLLPRKVLMIKFRGKFKALLMQRVAKGKLALLHGQTQSDIERLNSQLTKIPWNVKIHEPYPHGQGVVTYLAKYIKGGPIGNSRLVNAEEGEVTFRYRLSDSREGTGRHVAR